jgi:tetratricopeptide (TPR) repeat protein
VTVRPPFPGRPAALLAGTLVVAVSFAAFLPALQNGFTNWDDPYYVTGNAAIRSLSWPAVKQIFSSSVLGLYHPLTVLSLAVEHRLFGLDPQGYHAVSLALHLANTLLVLAVLRLLSGSLTAALAGSLLFGVHPVHVESVAWVAERKGVLSAFFFLGALFAYLRHLGARRPGAWYGLALALLAASLLCKPVAVAFPLVMYLCDYLKRRGHGARMHAEKIPFVALALLSSVTTLNAPGLAETGRSAISLGTDNVFVAAHSLLFSLGKALVPLRLSALYPYPAGTGWTLPWAYLLAPLPAALLVLAALRGARVSRHIPFGFLFFAATLLPVLVVRIGQHAAADRYLYLPSVGLCHLAGIGFARLVDGGERSARAKAAAVAALGLVAVAYSLLTWQRTQVWRDSLTLWDDVIAAHPEPGIAYLNRGLERFERGDAAGSVRDLTVFLAAQPLDPQAHQARGSALLKIGRVEAALEDFDRAVSLKPDAVEALNNRGAILAARGELSRAIDDFSRALAVDPRHRPALANRARARESLGDRAGAAQDLARLRALEP